MSTNPEESSINPSSVHRPELSLGYTEPTPQAVPVEPAESERPTASPDLGPVATEADLPVHQYAEPPPTDAPKFAWALWALHLGRVFPLHGTNPEGVCDCGAPDCGRNAGKHPKTLNGFLDGSADPEQVRVWWEEDPNANIGITGGPPKLDIDKKPARDGKAGSDGFKELRRLYGLDARDFVTLTVVTPNEGRHFYFTSAVEIPTGNGIFGPALDTRHTKGYVVGPGSRVGRQAYTIVAEPPGRRLALWPAEMREPIKDTPTTGTRATSRQQSPQPVRTLADARKLLEQLAPARWDDHGGSPGAGGWVDIGMALHAAFDGDDEALELWDEFSKKSSKHRVGICKRRWKSFTADKAGGLGYGSLVAWVRADNPTGGHVQMFSDIEERRLSFFWPKTLPWGSVVLFAGEPDEAKSLVTVDLVARASRGDTLPDGSRPEGTEPEAPITSLMVFLEDSAEAVVKPRLRVAGADQDRVGRFRMRVPGHSGASVFDLPAFPDDADALRSVIEKTGARLVVIDPITAFLGDKVNAWKSADVRKALAPLCQMAEELRVLFICIIHVNKNENAGALNRISESKAFAAVARVVYFFAADPDATGRRVMAPAKGNWLPEKRSYGYGVLSSPEDATYPIVAWDKEPGTRTAQQVLNGLAAMARQAAGQEKPTKAFEAATLLVNVLVGRGWVSTQEVKDQAARLGVSERWLGTVANKLGVKRRQTGKGKDHEAEWAWDDESRTSAY